MPPLTPRRAWIPIVAFAFLVLRTEAQQNGQSTAWLNGHWFTGDSFLDIDVFSVGGRLTLTRPRAVDRTVHLQGGHVTTAFGEAHTHNFQLAGDDTLVGSKNPRAHPPEGRTGPGPQTAAVSN